MWKWLHGFSNVDLLKTLDAWVSNAFGNICQLNQVASTTSINSIATKVHYLCLFWIKRVEQVALRAVPPSLCLFGGFLVHTGPPPAATLSINLTFIGLQRNSATSKSLTSFPAGLRFVNFSQSL